jgi:hypothetical protein
VAQSAARGVWDAEVGGSSPLTPTGFAGVTQLVESLPSKQVVAGSSPVSRSRKPVWPVQTGFFLL